jgi:hypothetical protein
VGRVALYSSHETPEPMHEISARKGSVRDIYFNIVDLRSGRLLVNDKTASILGDVIQQTL